MEVPKKWENSPVLQFNAFYILILTFEVNGQYSWPLNVVVKIVVMCFNNRQPYVHVRFHDQFVTWYQNSYMLCADFFGRGGAIVWPMSDFVGL